MVLLIGRFCGSRWLCVLRYSDIIPTFVSQIRVLYFTQLNLHYAMQLQPGTLLKAGSYRIIRTLGRGGFGITYLAEQVMVRRQVCVKEFFPKDYYKRDGDTRNITLSSDGFGQMMDKFKTKFLKEAQIIAGLDHPNIIRIHDVFEENGTAYYVMEYIEGESLQSIVSRRGALGRDEAVGYIEQLAAALGYIHAHDIAHLDVKPGNVMVRSKDDRALLIDFGLSKHYDSEGMQTSSTPLGISHGFAPIEQYQVGGVSTFSPRTDIYSMGATLYYLAMGKVPPAAANVGEDGLDELPSHFGAGVCTAIERSMQYRRKDRPASAEEFMLLVRGGGQTTFVDGPKRDEVQRREPQRDSRPEPRPSKPEDGKPKKSKWWLWLLLLATIIGGLMWIVGDGLFNTTTSGPYKVGDYYNENGKQGVVFEVWNNGLHGKIVSLDETQAVWDSRVDWDDDGFKNGTRTYADSKSDGKANTDKIMARSDSDYFSAFKWCRAKGSSWYLPSLNELNSIYSNKSTLNATLQKYGTALAVWYWTSTERVDYKPEFCAWGVYMGNGNTYDGYKDLDYSVRAVSAF